MQSQYDALKPYATNRQLEVIEAIETQGGQRAAARHLGVARTTVQDNLKAVQKKAAISGALPLTGMQPVPEPFLLKGESLLHNKRTGEDLLVWRKTKIDDAQRWEMIKEAIQGACKEVPRLPKSSQIKQKPKDLMNLITVSDCHIGLRVWNEECKNGDWDLKIAENVITKCFQNLIDRSPDAETCFISQLGDWLHWDGILPVTPTSGHVLDADSRLGKMIKVAIRTFRRIIEMALEKHNKVIVLCAEGNHDLSGSVWLRHLISALYENDTRVEVIESESPFYCYKFGRVMLGFHHSHLVRQDKIDRLFAAMFPEIWGETKFRFCHTGNFHHLKVLDEMGMTLIQHSTLVAPDSHSHRNGYMSNRETSLITYHKDRGRVSELVVTPEMVR